MRARTRWFSASAPVNRIAKSDKDAPTCDLAANLDIRIGEAERNNASCCDAVLAHLIRQCGESKSLNQGRRLHALIRRGQYSGNRYLGNLLVQMFGKCGSSEDSHSVFCSMSHKNLFSWTIMFAAYAQNGHITKARNMFNRMPQRDLVSWTAMIAAYAQNGHSKEALGILRTLDLEGMEADHVVVLTTLEACSLTAQVRLIHRCVSGTLMEMDIFVSTALITAYGKCRCTLSASEVFLETANKTLVTWNAMIAAYAHTGHAEEALKTLKLMDQEGMKPNPVTFISMMEVDWSLSDAKFMHARAVASGCISELKVSTALVSMYGRCGSVEDAKQVFDEALERNVVTWSAMVSAYARNEYGNEALELAMLMDIEGMLPNEITLVSVVDACSSVPDLKRGKLVHESITNLGTPLLLELGNALIHMYGKCGVVEHAKSVFKSMLYHDQVSWNALITAHAQNGLAKEALCLFQEMKLDGARPSELTFMSVLSVCSHAGLLECARQCFISIAGDFNQEPVGAHFSCMIDLLGRVGRINEGEELVQTMPFELSGLELASLLAGCKTHNNIRSGARVLGKLLQVDNAPVQSSPYVMFANLWRDGEF